MSSAKRGGKSKRFSEGTNVSRTPLGRKHFPEGRGSKLTMEDMKKALSDAAPGFDKVVPEFLSDGPTLANSILGGLAEPKRGIAGWQGGKIAEAMRRNMQVEIATSQKFVVDKSLMTEVMTASMVRPKKLLEMLHRGIPAFDNMFVEWDNFDQTQARHKAMNKYVPNMYVQWEPDERQKGRKAGFHIQRINDAILYTKYGYTGKDGEIKIASYPLGFRISNDDILTNEMVYGDGITGSIRPPKHENDMQEHREKYFRRMMASWYYERHEDVKVQQFFLDQIMMRTAVVQTAPMHWLVDEGKFRQGWTEQEMAGLMENFLPANHSSVETEGAYGTQGDVRFLIALLGMLNYDQVIHLTPETPKKVSHMRFGRKLPENEYKVVTIQLPKPQGVRIYEKQFTGHGTPKRQHWVRGHWRKYKGRAERTWIAPHIRGNSELGTIVHDYKLEKKVR
tara:strand:- start:234 stop:1583 length:1350 start_codon:yes stop_codon:yes gene_type:complete